LRAASMPDLSPATVKPNRSSFTFKVHKVERDFQDVGVEFTSESMEQPFPR